jgi:hypothetical protein
MSISESKLGRNAKDEKQLKRKNTIKIEDKPLGHWRKTNRYSPADYH